LTQPLLMATLALAFGLPALGLVISVVAMKFYKLDAKKMEEIQNDIAKVKANTNTKNDDIVAQ
ncbi:glucuronide permease, partial [Metabacillus sp. DBTR6]|nr:glucuronide permease [Metabacillus rhizolycopersici]